MIGDIHPCNNKKKLLIKDHKGHELSGRKDFNTGVIYGFPYVPPANRCLLDQLKIFIFIAP